MDKAPQRIKMVNGQIYRKTTFLPLMIAALLIGTGFLPTILLTHAEEHWFDAWYTPLLFCVAIFGIMGGFLGALEVTSKETRWDWVKVKEKCAHKSKAAPAGALAPSSRFDR